MTVMKRSAVCAVWVGCVLTISLLREFPSGIDL